jgi:hypothetical protein
MTFAVWVLGIAGGAFVFYVVALSVMDAVRSGDWFK